jgi:acetolactate synthase-1/2/3 large subunit
VTQPGEIIPAIKRAIKMTQEGTPALLEFITAKEIEYSIFR